MIRKTLQLLYHLGLILVALMLLGIVLTTIHLSAGLAKLPESLTSLKMIQPTRIYDRNNQLLAQLGSTAYVQLDEISPEFIDALLLAEDQQFYHHSGVNKLRLVNVTLRYFLAEGRAGASTLTQQLVKNYFLSPEKTVLRKVSEMLTAVQFELKYSKDEILTAYCNSVYFGGGSYGVEAAAMSFFGKHASELDYEEAAILVAQLPSSVYYSPRHKPENCKRRRDLILRVLHQHGKLSDPEFQELTAREIQVLPRRQKFGYILDYLLASWEDETESPLLDVNTFMYGGFSIYTAIDIPMQLSAQKLMRAQLDSLGKKLRGGSEGLQSAFIGLDPTSGGILVMQGGRDYDQSNFNRATSALRQPGSGFKPLLYYTALENSVSPRDVFVDEPTTFDIGYGKSWSPENWDGQFNGPMIMKQAFMKSLNVVAAQVGERVGMKNLIQTAQKLNFPEAFDPYLSLSLGATGVRPIEMVAAYATFVNSGYYQRPFIVRRVEDFSGNVIYQRESLRKRVLAAPSSYLVVDMLQDAVNSGTGTLIRRLGYRGTVGGKTGTTNDFRDSWFNGVTPWIVASVWVGYDQNASMVYRHSSRGVTGSSGALPIFARFLLENAPSRLQSQSFRIPSGISFLKVNPITGQQVPADSTGMTIALRQVDY